MGAWTSLVGFQRNIYRNRVVETHHKIKSRELELCLHIKNGFSSRDMFLRPGSGWETNLQYRCCFAIDDAHRSILSDRCVFCRRVASRPKSWYMFLKMYSDPVFQHMLAFTATNYVRSCWCRQVWREPADSNVRCRSRSPCVCLSECWIVVGTF